jgi:uncharacterized membrane protein
MTTCEMCKVEFKPGVPSFNVTLNNNLTTVCKKCYREISADKRISEIEKQIEKMMRAQVQIMKAQQQMKDIVDKIVEHSDVDKIFKKVNYPDNSLPVSTV